MSKLSQYNALINSDINEIIMHPNEINKIKIKVRNTGTMTWIPQKEKSINISYHILDRNGKTILRDGERTGLPYAIRTGEEALIDMKLKSPDTEGSYKIEIDMVHEGVTWFEQKGSKTLIINLEVKK
ncbi:hypothetical protein SAMN05443428_101224 [Caloramator quimbayensis]|uniref:Next to BRCA1 central domain-containing protein n=2 Tax=Caloramator quimbayensis TaxID=1147123 RepID=A0A1T4WI70_9CLOT|nr:hypothetical protein SAMN05443428_101224 [Caloramator quimbayensis]